MVVVEVCVEFCEVVVVIGMLYVIGCVRFVEVGVVMVCCVYDEVCCVCEDAFDCFGEVVVLYDAALVRLELVCALVVFGCLVVEYECVVCDEFVMLGVVVRVDLWVELMLCELEVLWLVA